MELKDFIVKTLSDIIDATIETQMNYCSDIIYTAPVINPLVRIKEPLGAKTEISIEKVHFDLSIAETENLNGKIGITVLGMGGAKGIESTQKVSFDIPLNLPTFSPKKKP